MAQRAWEVNGHNVELEHGFWSGEATISVDGQTIYERPSAVMDVGFVHHFDVDGVPCAVRVVSQVYNFRYELLTGEDAESFSRDRVIIEMPIGQLAIALTAGLIIVVGTLYGITLLFPR